MEQRDFIRKAEEQHLKSCMNVIRGNIDRLSGEVSRMREETKELYDNYRSGDGEMHNELVISMDLLSTAEQTLRKNLLAEQKAYFGRIDYEERLFEEGTEGFPKFSLYIGKNGIMQSASDILIVDWRAPVASVYYDSDIGESHYDAPTGEVIPIDLQLKRTFELDGEQLHDFYDTDVITNDEFLTKYLAKNKEVVLGEIIATIQKEQNLIIRDTPWHTVIVQGVAGSGKTTVAMHRISYILYNFKDRFKPQEFYVIGSNKMLINYITSVLPSLDVSGINQMTLQEMLVRFLDKDLPAKWTVIPLPADGAQHFKGSLDFMLALEYWLAFGERKAHLGKLAELPEKKLMCQNRLVYGWSEMQEFLQTFSTFQPESGTTKSGGVSAEEKVEMLNQRVVKKVQNICELLGMDRDEIRKELMHYRGFFGKAKNRYKVADLYPEFLEELHNNGQWYRDLGLTIPEELYDTGALDAWQIRVNKKQVDLYDMAAMLLIKKRMKACDDLDLVSHVVVDEAQDFGVSAFYSLHQAFPAATFTIMGDVSQNVYFDVGMNDWSQLREQVFGEERDRFYRLVKSYRNTVEISHFAGKLLEKGSFETYAIDPVIRHGKEVTFLAEEGAEAMADRTAAMLCDCNKDGLSTLAVVCRDPEECDLVSGLLCEKLQQMAPEIPFTQVTEELEDVSHVRGIMVLPVTMTKGLEFDGVFLWNPTEEHYPMGDANVKLLYVAVTRALHELYIMTDKEKGLCRLLQIEKD